MADLYPVSGMKFYIGGAVTVPDGGAVSGSTFSGVTYVEVDGWTQAGAFGDAAEVITSQMINRSRDVKQKGTRNAGSMENRFAWLPGDAGQEDAIAAEATANNYAFKIEGPDTGGTTPTKWEFLGMVTSAQQQGGGANTILELALGVEINTNIVETAAT